MELDFDKKKTTPAPAPAPDPVMIVSTETAKPEKVAPASYVSTRGNYSLRLRPPVRTNVAGKEYRKAGLRANFHDHRLTTTNAEIINALDEMLLGDQGQKWQRWFYKVPSDDVIRTVGKAQQKAQEVAKKEIEKNMDDAQRKDYDGWQSFLKKQKSKQPQSVAGMVGTRKEGSG